MIKIILPIMNSSVILVRGPTHYLDDNIWTDKLSDEEFGVISKAPVEYSERVKPEHRCIFIEIDNNTDIEAKCSFMATVCRYVLNYFRAGSPVAIPFAIAIEKKSPTSRATVTKAFDLDEELRHSRKFEKYSIKSGTSRETISKFYKLVSDACNKHKKLKLTISRFNSALTRSKIGDKIIDATISLESMVQDDKNELSFKFALFNSYAANKDPEKRGESFELFKKLYSTRSKIVHGALDDTATEKLLAQFEKDWIKIEEISWRAINELIFFIKDNNPADWTKHLLGRVINSNNLSPEV